MKNENIEKRRRQCNKDVLEYLKSVGYFFNPKYEFLIKVSLDNKRVINKRIIKSIWDIERFILIILKKEYELEGISFDILKTERAAKRIIKELPKFNIEFEG